MCERIVMKDWKTTFDDTEFMRFQKTFDDGTDVIFYIQEADSVFIVRSLVETRTSGPVDTIVIETDTLENAYKIIDKKCNDWDLRQTNNEEDWSSWKIKK